MLSINYAYFTNHEDYSVLATLISNFSDFFLNFGKFLRDIGMSDAYVTSGFAVMTLSWFFTRVLYFPYCNYVATEKLQPYRINPYPQYERIW
jgi:hypothetical protein